MTTEITIHVDRDKGTLTVEVPVPKEGKWVPPETKRPGEPADPRPTQEQHAHWVFWTDGTAERIAELVKAGPTGRDTLVWLLGMRIAAVKEKTKFTYELSVDEPATSVRRRTVSR